MRLTRSDLLFVCAVVFTLSNLFIASFRAPYSTDSLLPSLIAPKTRRQTILDVYDAFVGANENDPRQSNAAPIEEQEGGNLDEDDEDRFEEGGEDVDVDVGNQEQGQPLIEVEGDNSSGDEENYDLPDDMDQDNDIGGDPEVDTGLNSMINVDTDDALYDDNEDQLSNENKQRDPVATTETQLQKTKLNNKESANSTAAVHEPNTTTFRSQQVTLNHTVNINAVINSPVTAHLQKNTSLQLDRITTTNGSTDSNSTKPILLLHVGPRETGTQTIQNGILRNESLVSKLHEDGWTKVSFSYTKLQQMASQCFEKKANCKLWDDLVEEYHSIRKSGENAIQSAELYSKIPFTPFVAKKLSSLAQTWTVRIVMVYKPLYEWLPDMYTQARKRNAYDAKKQTFRLLSSRKKLLPNLRTFAAYFENEFLPKMSDPLATYEFYSTVFGKESIIVLKAEDTKDETMASKLVEDFVCRAMSPATHACSYNKAHPTLYKPEVGDAEALKLMGSRLDHDLLALEAVSKGFVMNSELSTTSVLAAVERRLNERNITISTVEPRISISSAHIEWLWNRTLVGEELMMGSHETRGQETIHSEWKEALANSKFSTVDAAKVLDDPKWRDIFDSLDGR